MPSELPESPESPELLRIPKPVECKIVRRVNRFVVEVEVGGIVERAYTNNTGRLTELLFEGNRGECVEKSGGKTKYRLFAVACDDGYALIDTQYQMRAFEASCSHINWLECSTFRRNVRILDSVIDYEFSCGAFVEVKSAAMKVGEYAMYPDCPTERGRKHVRTMKKLAEKGERAIIVFIASVPSVKAFKPNRDADPALYQLLTEAIDSGVELRAVNVIYSDRIVRLANPDLPVEV